MTRVKICGITVREDLATVVEAGADAVGFTVDVPVETPREITPDLAVELSRATPPFVTTVLVTMPDTPESTVELAERIQPDVVQIHGNLNPGELAYLSAKIHGEVIKAVSPENAERYDTVADALLVDSLDASGAGGTGERHDWNRTRELVASLSSPIILAGGLTPENVAGAVETVAPFGVDVASGVESRPGRKDPNAVTSFVSRAGGRP
ncbi:MAG: phosphoribosylanthranilate isomerase [Halobacteriota archaeon]|uniref:phosphoribosylanthranilate isomerase n=1 Tax=Natronomonas sp. TaxID=2184060 RepID=UPI00397530DF